MEDKLFSMYLCWMLIWLSKETTALTTDDSLCSKQMAAVLPGAVFLTKRSLDPVFYSYWGIVNRLHLLNLCSFNEDVSYLEEHIGFCLFCQLLPTGKSNTWNVLSLLIWQQTSCLEHDSYWSVSVPRNSVSFCVVDSKQSHFFLQSILSFFWNP